jgi:hypothetical protein
MLAWGQAEPSREMPAGLKGLRVDLNRKRQRDDRKRRLTTAVCGAAPALAKGYFVQRQGSRSSIRWMG